MEVELIQEDLLANDLTIEGEYMSEDAMKTVWGWSEYLGQKSGCYHSKSLHYSLEVIAIGHSVLNPPCFIILANLGVKYQLSNLDGGCGYL